MHILTRACLITALLTSAHAEAKDPFLGFDKERYGVSVARKRSVFDYAAVNAFSEPTSRNARIIVTTESLAPDAELYAVAESFANGLRELYPSTEFHVFGRADNSALAKAIRENFDYAFVVGTNQMTKDYDREETVYGSRSSGVNCSRSTFNGDVNCRETGTQSVPIGTRKAQSTIFTSILFANFGPARQVMASYTDASFSTPGLTVSSPIGHVATTIRYGQSDSSWCENEAASLANLARMTGLTSVSTRPDEVSLTTSPEEIGCND